MHVSVRRVLLLVCCASGLAVADNGEWKTYTSKRNVRDLTVNRGVVWAATSGGMFSYNLTDRTFTQFTTSEGLRTIDLTAIAIDSNRAVWIGASNGFLHRFNPSKGEWQYVTDIAELLDPLKRINRLNVVGDTLFILSDIGVSLFSISRMEFIATYRRFGTGTNPIVGGATSMVMFDGRLWIGIRGGIAATSVVNPNPSAPESWQVYTTTHGLPSDTINQLVVADDSLFAATGAGLAVFAGELFYTVNGTSGNNTLDLTSRGDSVFFLTANQLWRYVDQVLTPSTLTIPPVTLSTFFDETVLGTATNGILVLENPQYIEVIPSGPPSNWFVGLAVDERGVVWSGTGTRNGEGFMSFDGTTWRHYTTAQYPELRDNNYYKVSIGKDNAKWVANWGKGVALLDDAGNVNNVFNWLNGLPPTVRNDTFVVVGGVAADRNGVTWITSRTPPENIAVILFRPDSSLDSSVRFYQSMQSPPNIFTDVVIDFNGTKWFANFSRFEPEAAIGFFYYNEFDSLPGTTQGWGRLTTEDELTSNRVYSVAVDREGEVWIGSDAGITIIFNPGNPRAGMAAYHPPAVQNQIIQAIIVDPLNNKWIATKQGVFVLSSDGTSLLRWYTVENTGGKLLDNDVASIAMDVNTGTVYFGTEKGLSSLRTLAVNPSRSFGELTLSPNPFYIPSNTQLAVVDTIGGLVQNSTIKILTSDGRFVRELRARTEASPGGRLSIWDGRNDRGELVATGIYIIVASSEDGSKVTTGKIAVIRK